MAFHPFRGSGFNLNVQSDPQRSAMAQMLLAQSLQNTGRGSRSVAESAAIATPMILGALLQKRDQKAQAAEQMKQRALANQLVGNQLQTGISVGDPTGGPASQFSVPSMSPVDPQREALAGILAQSPQAMGQLAMQQMSKPKEEQYTLPMNAVRMQGGQLIASNPAPVEPPKDMRTDDEKEYDRAVSQGYKGSFRDYMLENKRAGAMTINMPSEGERRAGFASQNLMNLEDQVHKVFKDNPDFNPGKISEARGYAPGPLGNVLASKGFRQYRAAADEWTANAVFLRSGATSRQEEKDSAFRNMWPQPGDDVETMMNREQQRIIYEKQAFEYGGRANRIDSDEAIKAMDKMDQRMEELNQMRKLVEAARAAGKSEDEIIKAYLSGD